MTQPAQADGSGAHRARPMPWYFRMVRELERREVRGSTRLRNWMLDLGLLDAPALIALSDEVNVVIPLNRPTLWDEADVVTYEAPLVNAFAAFLQQQQNASFLDCGADVGLISMRVLAACPALRALVAFEPSSRAFPYLMENIAAAGPLPVQALAMNVAVADFDGKGRLGNPPHDSGDHARFLIADESGDIRVTRIDELGLPTGGAIAIKLDLEGGELPALRGARDTLRGARNLMVTVEAHPKQVERTGVDPTACIAYLRSIRPVRAEVLEEPTILLDFDRPFFSQASPGRIYNIAVYSDD